MFESRFDDIVIIGRTAARNRPKARTVKWKQQARTMVCEARLLALLLRHPHVPWSAKAAAGCATAYLLSPIQLIPTFIPVIGQLDDMLVLFLGMKLARKLTPPWILAECEEQAKSALRPVTFAS